MENTSINLREILGKEADCFFFVRGQTSYRLVELVQRALPDIKKILSDFENEDREDLISVCLPNTYLGLCCGVEEKKLCLLKLPDGIIYSHLFLHRVKNQENNLKEIILKIKKWIISKPQDCSQRKNQLTTY